MQFRVAKIKGKIEPAKNKKWQVEVEKGVSN
jgi:flavin-binding protein dodecin